MQIESASLAKHRVGQADFFFFLCKTFQGLKYINDSLVLRSRKKIHTVRVSHLFSQGRSFLDQLRGTQGVSLSSSLGLGRRPPLRSRLKFQEEFQFYSL